MGEAADGAARRGNFSETPRFDLLGIMIDISRNGVLTPEAARAMLRRCALMGLNMAILYSEDTYEVPGEPFFGYLRGRCTHDEMKSLDDYADALGIEMFPCIQALAHLEQVLQWPAYAEYRDTDDVLLAGEEKTYALLDKMIAAASAPFRSRRIHLGMDEAHGIGSGRYRRTPRREAPVRHPQRPPRPRARPLPQARPPADDLERHVLPARLENRRATTTATASSRPTSSRKSPGTCSSSIGITTTSSRSSTAT